MDKTDAMILERRRAGMSYRDIATWLTARGHEMSHMAVKRALDRLGAEKPGIGAKGTGATGRDAKPAKVAKKRASGGIQAPPAAEPPPSQPPELGGGDEEDVPPAPDLEALDRAISELERDIAEARTRGNMHQANAMRRIWLDARAKASKLRPAPEAPDEAAVGRETMARARQKLVELVEQVRAATGGAPP